MKNYLEHETEVKFYDYLLSQETDWQWFIDTVESDFEGFDDYLSNWADFLSAYKNVVDIYGYFVRVNCIGDIKVNFCKTWTKELFICSLMFNGKITFENAWKQLNCIFSKMFAISVFTAKLINSANTTNYIANLTVFTQHNVYKLYNLNDIALNEDLIKDCLHEIKFDQIEKIIKCFENNLSSVEALPDIELIIQHKHELLNVNAFKYQRIIIPDDVSWEHRYLFDMLNVKITKDEILPMSNFDGVSYPNIKLWTKQLLNDLNSYFRNDIASFVIETIRFVLYNIEPSEKTISYHFELVNNFLKSQVSDVHFYLLNVSSLIVINKLRSNKMINQPIREKYMKDFSLEMGKFSNPQTIYWLQQNESITTRQQNKALSDYNIDLSKKIYDVRDITGFFEFCKNKHIVKGLHNEQLEESVNVFNSLILKIDSALLASLFLEYMRFLLSVTQNNIDVNKPRVKAIMIQLQIIWQQEYYNKCIKSMHTIGYKNEISKSQIATITKTFLTDTFLVAKLCMPTDENHILDSLIISSENPLHMLCNNVNITKTYPQYPDMIFENHDVDQAFLKIIEKLQKDKGYKLLNYVEPKKAIEDLYNMYESNTQLYMAFFSDVQTLYDKLKNEMPEYNLMDFDGANLFPAHLLQLFPILENKIREFGVFFNIVPFKENLNEFLHMKDASSVLQQILMGIYSETGSFDGLEDFFFVYQSMYNGNNLNIRNEACHGRDYLEGSRLLFAFKVTLFCLNLILNRINSIKNKTQIQKELK